MATETYFDHNLALLTELRDVLANLGERDQVPDESHSAFIERLDELIRTLPTTPEDHHLGQDLICQVFHRYPQIAHLVPRDLLWFFGGDCLHYMPDDEISLYQQLDERRHDAEANGESFDWQHEQKLMVLPGPGNRH